ncbi:MAG: hypothetical protein ACKVU2_00830 [Saprospiraceae bacterium]
MDSRAIILCLLTMAAVSLPERFFAQAKATAVFDPARVSMGDTFTLRVLVAGTRTAPKRVSLTAWQRQIPTENILSQSAWQRSGEHWVQRFTLIALDSTTQMLPRLTVYLHLGDTVQTNPVQLTVTASTNSSDVQDLDDIRDIHREPVLWYDYWPWVAGMLVVLLVLKRLFRRRPKPRYMQPEQPIAQPGLPPPSAREVALEKLAKLEKEKPWLDGHLLAYYAALSMIVREYIEHRHGVPAMESTTREIADLLKNSDFPSEQRPALDFLLQQTDLVKFAEMVPSSDYHLQALNKAKQLVGGPG